MKRCLGEIGYIFIRRLCSYKHVSRGLTRNKMKIILKTWSPFYLGYLSGVLKEVASCYSLGASKRHLNWNDSIKSSIGFYPIPYLMFLCFWQYMLPSLPLVESRATSELITYCKDTWLGLNCMGSLLLIYNKIA